MITFEMLKMMIKSKCYFSEIVVHHSNTNFVILRIECNLEGLFKG